MHPKVISDEVLGRGCSRSHRSRIVSGWRDAVRMGVVVDALWKMGCASIADVNDSSNIRR